MPFTLAHPAAVLPVRKALPEASPVGLVIGSMTPDLVYFLPIGVSGAQSHSFFGLLWFCVPMGVGAWLALRYLFAPAFERFLPSGVSARLCPGRAKLSLRRVGAVGAATLVGAATHVVWDSFTHSSGAAVQALPYLRHHVTLAAGYSPAVFTVLQHVSTLLGLVVLLAWSSAWYRRTPPADADAARGVPASEKSVVFGAVLLPAIATAFVVLAPALSASPTTFVGLQRAIGRAAFASGSALLAALLVVALIIRSVTNSGRGEGAA